MASSGFPLVPGWAVPDPSRASDDLKRFDLLTGEPWAGDSSTLRLLFPLEADFPAGKSRIVANSPFSTPREEDIAGSFRSPRESLLNPVGVNSG